ncbi:flagellar hook-length control protein FliK [Sedimenticola thiotaurini]|uniref:Flagellar hook-length control protein-like C-terminal domain-containing protein n=1 Tax=Sedimenticola thiotaurini TaxID=1543721 RepID=A0A0F7JVX6_9GAMM|nr:flagellar hook-length control protein FliK [Sedimenticola thiotaurini]AKH19549.1 hypothetical protein AAY24_03355 [Sedimenticola thiotaurini]
MQITDPISNPRLFIEQTRANALQQLRPGQVVQAVVEAPASKGIAQLNVGGVSVPVKTGIQLATGQQLTLDVVKSGNMPEFQVVREATAASTRALALKDVLPKQLPLNQLLDSLKALSTPSLSGSANGGLPAGTQNAVGKLFQQLLQLTGQALPGQSNGPNGLERNLQLLASALQGEPGLTAQSGRNSGSTNELARQLSQLINQLLPTGQPVTGSAIRQAFLQSGLFMEPHLLKGLEAQQDMKGNLLKLLEMLQPMLQMGANSAAIRGDAGAALQLLAAKLFAELHQKAEGALARVQLHQLASMPDENNPRQFWQFELPIPHPDGHDEFLIQFGREAKPAGQEGDRWSVTLNFNIEPTGPVSARLSLSGEEISSHFIAEQPEGANRIEQLLPTLREAFIKAGLQVGKLSAGQGVATNKRADQPPSPLPLLDERA